MKNRIFTYLKNIFGTLFFLLITGLIILLSMNGSVNLGTNEVAKNLHNEGPYIFFENDSVLSVNYLKGNKDDGFEVDCKKYSSKNELTISSFFPLDSTYFNFNLKTAFNTPKSIYDDDYPIIAISDIESGYKSFRDFLIKNQVIDSNLQWTFGKGHLVLVGDFVDRGASTTQVLWFIYKLEQEAAKNGGMVHFIIGNHEIKNLQGDYLSSSLKYKAVSAILEKQQFELFNKKSFLGKWLSSKNVIERINGNLFVHGGIHPDITSYAIDLDSINTIVRKNYALTFYPKKQKSLTQFLTSTRTGLAWYRGYFKDNVSEEQIESCLKKFNANSIIVGHTLQRKVKKLFNGKLYAIDIKHPKDYETNWPLKKSEGLLIKNNAYYRATHNGKTEKL
ncbi:metallophosphoesterase [Tenacibaculum sp. TC6]|uniref:metallophosphoesterase n=1 Tax=Tenacibaculum sp. TC6 TaxID=3423223 RepID=UPI003D35B91F